MDYDYLARIKASIMLYTHKKTSNVLDGEFSSIYRGRSFDFDDLREYVYGDSVRDIDWKSSSKTGRVLIRRFIADKKHNILLIGDAGAKFMGDTDKGEPKKDIALNVMGTISYLVNDHGAEFVRADLHLPPPEAHEVGKTGVRADADAALLAEGDGLFHDQRDRNQQIRFNLGKCFQQGGRCGSLSEPVD